MKNLEASTSYARNKRSGWIANTKLHLSDTRVLYIRTHKGHQSGTLETTVQGATDKGGGGFSIVIGRNGDFRESLLITPCKRVTEKAVREQHQAFIEDALRLANLAERANVYYAEQIRRHEAEKRGTESHHEAIA